MDQQIMDPQNIRLAHDLGRDARHQFRGRLTAQQGRQHPLYHAHTAHQHGQGHQQAATPSSGKLVRGVNSSAARITSVIAASDRLSKVCAATVGEPMRLAVRW